MAWRKTLWKEALGQEREQWEEHIVPTSDNNDDHKFYTQEIVSSVTPSPIAAWGYSLTPVLL